MSSSKEAILTAPERPATLTVNPDGIPAELRELRQWVCWRWEQRTEGKGKRKWTKLHCQANGRRPASSTDTATWRDFAGAFAAYQSRGWAGVGFAFAVGGGLVGVDLDECRDQESGYLQPWATAIVADLATYTEVSPSGTGVKDLRRLDNRERAPRAIHADEDPSEGPGQGIRHHPRLLPRDLPTVLPPQGARKTATPSRTTSAPPWSTSKRLRPNAPMMRVAVAS